MSTQPQFIDTILDANGDPVPGAKINYFIAETVTRQETYSDPEQFTVNPNPIIADGNGRYATPYLLQDRRYKIRVTDANDVILYEIDKVVPSAPSDVAANTSALSVTPGQFGARGDGLSDDSVQLQAAIDAATRYVDLAGKTYRVTTQLTMRSGVVIRNGSLKYDQALSINCIEFRGPLRPVSSYTISFVGVPGGGIVGREFRTLATDIPDIRKGDVIVVPGTTDSDEVEVHLIDDPDGTFSESGVDGTAIIVERDIEYDGNDITAIYDPVFDAGLENVSILVGSNCVRGLVFIGARDCFVRNVSIEVEASSSLDELVQVRDSYRIDVDTLTVVRDGSDTAGSTAIAHGPARHITATRVHVPDTMRIAGPDIFNRKIIDCTYSDCVGGNINIKGRRVLLEDVRAEDVTLDGDEFDLRRCAGDVLIMRTGDFTLRDSRFRQGVVGSFSDVVEKSGLISGCVFDNTSDPSGQTALSIGTSSSAPDTGKVITVEGCRVETNDGVAADVNGSTQVVFTGCSFRRSGTGGPPLRTSGSPRHTAVIGCVTRGGNFGLIGNNSETTAVGNRWLDTSTGGASTVAVDIANVTG